MRKNSNTANIKERQAVF